MLASGLAGAQNGLILPQEWITVRTNWNSSLSCRPSRCCRCYRCSRCSRCCRARFIAGKKRWTSKAAEAKKPVWQVKPKRKTDRLLLLARKSDKIWKKHEKQFFGAKPESTAGNCRIPKFFNLSATDFGVKTKSFSVTERCSKSSAKTLSTWLLKITEAWVQPRKMSFRSCKDRLQPQTCIRRIKTSTFAARAMISGRNFNVGLSCGIRIGYEYWCINFGCINVEWNVPVGACCCAEAWSLVVV